jgi:outer membrane protein assembly factor BamA
LKNNRLLNIPQYYRLAVLAVLMSVLFFSCSPVKYVQEEDYLLDRYRIKITEGKINKEDLRNYIRQKPNKRILGIRFHLGMYNLSSKKKQKGISNWLRTIGEEPVIFDEFLTQKSKEQLKSYLNNKGYYNSVVTDTIQFRRSRARVLYKVDAKKPYKIREVTYTCSDSSLAPIVLPDTVNSLIDVDDNFDLDILQEERERIETQLKNKGYYTFSKDFINFQADSSAKDLDVALNLNVKRRPVKKGNVVELTEHKKYTIRNVYVFTNFDQKIALEQKELYYDDIDTTFQDGMFFVSKWEDKLNRRVIHQSNFIVPGDFYSLNNANKTYRSLNSLRLFKIINIQYSELDSTHVDSLGYAQLDCHIQLTKYYLQSYTVELQGTNSYGNIGAGGSFLYQHRSLFGGAEITDFKINGSIETIDEQSLGGNDYTTELGGNITISIPKFILPIFKAEKFSKKFTPKTQISVGYNFQDRIEYKRSIANISYGYNWDGNRYLKHYVKLVELNAIDLKATDSFTEYIDSTYLKSSYENHLVSVSNYSLVFNNQDIKKNRDFYFFRMNSEFSGNILSLASQLANATKVDEKYEVLGIPFSQYFKVDFDFRYYDILDKSSSIAYRLFAGVGIPYGNSEVLPFEKMYFSGGANSLRAWNVRDVGPGSYSGGSRTRFPNQTGDIKLEANLEYRFKMFWVLEGAFFIDAGNVWSLNSDEFEGGLFRKDKFYKEFAVGSGFGTRLDFSFFIFRIDLGVKLRDPALSEGQRWIVGNRALNWQYDFTINIGIGYPF